MKLKRNVIVRIEDADGSAATLEFKKQTLNELLDAKTDDLEKNPEKLKEYFTKLGEKLIKISDLEDEDGNSISEEDFKGFDIPADFMLKVVRAYNDAMNVKAEDPKNVPSASESPTD